MLKTFADFLHDVPHLYLALTVFFVLLAVLLWHPDVVILQHMAETSLGAVLGLLTRSQSKQTGGTQITVDEIDTVQTDGETK